MDKIFLRALKTEAIVGIFDWERQVKQTVILDIEISADIRKAALSDSIDDTLNYKRVAKRVLGFVEESKFHLVETLAEKCRRAHELTGHRRLVIAGGVGANIRLRERLAGVARDAGAELYFPRAEFCTDNGAMIALAGCMRLAAGLTLGRSIDARANWQLGDSEATGMKGNG